MMTDRPNRFLLFAPSPCGDAGWHPLVDVYRGRFGWLLKFDLAGVRPEDVTVQLNGCRITVSGIRRDWLLDEGYSYYSMEICYSRFERSVELPCDLARTRFTIEHRHGMLLVSLAEEGER